MLNVVILAAGKGTRMHSNTPKVLHTIAGQPMLKHVLNAARGCTEQALTPLVVVGHGAEQVEQVLAGEACRTVLQAEQLGTGHAVNQALPYLDDNAVVLVLYADVPLISAGTLAKLVAQASDKAMALLTVNLDDPSGYGRIVRKNGKVCAIVEQKDATAEQLAIKEINTGIMAVSARHLRSWLPALSNANAQGEYYLTDIIAMADKENLAINVCQPETLAEVEGVNNRVQQAQLERLYQQRQAHQLLTAGVMLADPNRFDCRGSIQAGRDVFIDINCTFTGDVSLGDNVIIGPNCHITDSHIAAGTHINANSVVESAEVGENCNIGPFARLRPGTVLQKKAKVGNFVEIKKSVIGAGSKVNHLSYIGDCTMGDAVNIGAGTITCNYDGVNKFHTEIGNQVFVGSNSALVAPLKLAAQTTIGAGSVITSDTDDNDLALGRARQRNIKNWPRPVKQ